MPPMTNRMTGDDDSSSFHIGGANHLFGDGSGTISRETAEGAPPPVDRLGDWAVGTRAEGDLTGAIEN